MATVGTLAVNIVARTDKFRRGVTSVQRLSAKGAMALTALGSAAAGVGVAMLRTSETINRSMTKSLAIMGDVSDKMRNDMVSAANEVARKTEASTAQAAESYFFLASAGLSAEQSLRAMPVVAQFAQAGNFDLARATDLATDAQSALGMSSKDTQTTIVNLTRVTDVLVKANTLANASVEQFSEALTNGAAAALRLVGKDMEEGVAVLAAYADQGIKGAEAGTALGIVMRDLQTKAIQNKRAFAAAGVTVFDAAGEMQNLGGIVADLEGLLAGLSDEQSKFTLLSLGFSDRSVKYIQSLVGMSEKIAEYEKNLKSASGTAAEVAEKSMTDLQKAAAETAAAWDKMSLSVGQSAEKLGLFKAAAEGMEGFSILLDNATGNGKNGRKKDLLELGTTAGGGFNPLNNLREGFQGWADMLGLTPNHVDAANPQWAIDQQAKLDAAGGSAQTMQARENAEAFGKIFSREFGKVLGVGRRGAMAAGGAFDSLGKLSQGNKDAAMQNALGQLTFGLMGTKQLSNGGHARRVAHQAGIEELESRLAAAGGGSSSSRSRSGSLSLARSGSAESYRQQAAIRRQSDAGKFQKSNLKKLDGIKTAIEKANQNPVFMEAANVA